VSTVVSLLVFTINLYADLVPDRFIFGVNQLSDIFILADI